MAVRDHVHRRTVEWTTPEYERLRAAAARAGLTVSDLIRLATAQAADDIDAMARLRALGLLPNDEGATS